MKKLRIIFLILVLILGFQVAAQAINAIPALEVKIGEETTSFELTKGKTGYYLPETTFQTTEGSITVAMDSNIDPFITMAIGAVNNTGGNLGFAFAVALPINLPPLPTIINASLVGGLTDSTGNGVSITPFLTAAILDNSVVPPGFTWGTGPAVVFGPGASGAFYVYGPFAVGPAAGPVGGAMLFTESLSFILSGNSDAAALTAHCSINPIPVPPALVLMGSGLLGLVGWRKFRQI